MLPIELFHNRMVSSTTVIGMIANLVFYGIVFTFSLFFQSIWGLTPERTGLAFLPMMAVLMVMNVMAGRLAGRRSARALTVVGLLISSIGYLFMLPARIAQSYWLLVLPMLLAGGGISLAVPTITNAMLEAVGSSRSGVASGLFNAARQIGGIIGVALFGSLIRHSEITLFLHGMEEALAVSVGLPVQAAGIAMRYMREAAHETGSRSECKRDTPVDRPAASTR